ncbi:MAG: DUF1800 domain-containing protein [Pseudomonadota bacterium]|nr:DUF1800 domain-containing protein [Pseudomonadota bacterium]MEC8619674.1 DUF1800 domain-containing protein [Pseudomonadota bacterium]
MSSIIRWQYCIVSGVRPYRAKLIVLMALIGGIAFSSAGVMAKSEMLGPLNLSPLQSTLTEPQAKHLASRAGFGATQEEIVALIGETPKLALEQFMNNRKDDSSAPAFRHSGIFDEGLDPFPPSRPATTEMAKRQGNALGIAVKPDGNRPLQPIVNKFFYWLRASRLETDRVAYWWANRMLASEQPLREKAALFWHGHFATNEDKVRDYRKMLIQVETFQRLGLANFRDLLIAIAQDPAMLVFLDAGVNTKDSLNENFAREIMELFTMGVGEYSEEDVREAARAFTGWSVKGLEFHIDPETHDAGAKDFLGERGHFDGIEIIDRILARPQTSQFIAAKLYRYFVQDDLSPAAEEQLGQRLRHYNYEIGDFLTELFVSQDFYASAGEHIKSPVELVVSTYKKMGLTQVPGVPDFNVVTGALGQRLMHPPTVAGWSQGRSWITPSLLFERGNFVLDVVSPDLNFVPPDRFPTFTPEVARVQKRLRSGMSISNATMPTGMMGTTMAQSNALADRDEAFNTRLGSMRGWQMAIERVRPIPRDFARLQLVKDVQSQALSTPLDVVLYLERRFFEVPLLPVDREELAEFLADALGTADIAAAGSYAEDSLRRLLHAMLSRPEYQLG